MGQIAMSPPNPQIQMFSNQIRPGMMGMQNIPANILQNNQQLMARNYILQQQKLNQTPGNLMANVPLRPQMPGYLLLM
jgi:hypothetical protein